MGFYLLILMIIIVAVTFLNPMQTETKTLSYSELLDHLDTNDIKDLEINESTVTGTLNDGTKFEAIAPQYVIDQQISQYITANPDMDVTIAKPNDSWWVSMIPTVIMVVIMIVFFMMIWYTPQ